MLWLPVWVSLAKLNTTTWDLQGQGYQRGHWILRTLRGLPVPWQPSVVVQRPNDGVSGGFGDVAGADRSVQDVVPGQGWTESDREAW